MTYVQRTICPYDCPTSCGLLAETDGKKILRVKGALAARRSPSDEFLGRKYTDIEFLL